MRRGKKVPSYAKDRYKRYRRYYQRIIPLLKRPATRAYMGFILSLFTISFFAFFAIRPTVNTIVELLRKIEDGKYTSKKLTEKITALSTAQNTYFQLMNDLDVVYEAIPSDALMEDYVVGLENVILASRVEILGTQIGNFKISDEDDTRERVKKESASQVRVMINTQGKYENVLNMLENLQSVRRITSIEGASIASGGEGKDKLTLTIRAKTYFIPD